MEIGQEETVLADPAIVAAWAKEAGLEGLQTASERMITSRIIRINDINDIININEISKPLFSLFY